MCCTRVIMMNDMFEDIIQSSICLMGQWILRQHQMAIRVVCEMHDEGFGDMMNVEVRVRGKQLQCKALAYSLRPGDESLCWCPTGFG